MDIMISSSLSRTFLISYLFTHSVEYTIYTSSSPKIVGTDGRDEKIMDMKLGLYENRINDRLNQWDEINMLDRLRQKDLSLWNTRKGEVTDMLGWLSLGKSMSSQLDDILEFSDQMCNEGFTKAVLLGMGGSSMASCVFKQTLGSAEGYLDLIVLDSTHPDTIRNVTDTIDISNTLFITSSKSGETIETLSMFRYFWDEVQQSVTDPGRHFIAITDPNTPLAKLANQRNFRKIFEANIDVGGRYSALSAFGLVPAALLGIDIRLLLTRAFNDWDMAKKTEQQEGLILGAALGEFTIAGRDKATLIMSDSLRSFSLWAEQLIAESTGKDGRGIVPVVREPWIESEEYGQDRVFVGLSLEGEQWNVAERLDELAADHPTIHMIMDDPISLGKAMFEWELAIASAAIIMEIDPFDQPDVQATKELAWDLVSNVKSRERRSHDINTFYLDEPDELKEAAEEWIREAQPDDYISIQAYLSYDNDIRDGLRLLQGDILSATGLATILDQGPRFLHSTGQLYKGGPGTGLFLQLVEYMDEDIPIPDTDYSFGTLTSAEALGDIIVLKDRGRRVLRINLGREGSEGIAKLRDLLNVMFQTEVIPIMT